MTRPVRTNSSGGLSQNQRLERHLDPLIPLTTSLRISQNHCPILTTAILRARDAAMAPPSFSHHTAAPSSLPQLPRWRYQSTSHRTDGAPAVARHYRSALMLSDLTAPSSLTRDFFSRSAERRTRALWCQHSRIRRAMPTSVWGRNMQDDG